jgi:hypothetical protein
MANSAARPARRTEICRTVNRRPIGTPDRHSADGYVVTNHHVVENATEVTVTLDDGKTVPATIVGTDKKTDLALLKIKQGGPYQPVGLASFVAWVAVIRLPSASTIKPANRLGASAPTANARSCRLAASLSCTICQSSGSRMAWCWPE